MRILFLSTVALAALAGTAFAADLPSRRAPPVYVPPPVLPTFTWTGFYVGVQGGYEFGRSNALATSTLTGAGLAANGSSPKGFIGGAHVGYNYQFPGGALMHGVSFVAGVEGDVDGSTYKTSYLLGGIQNYANQPIQGSVRGRLGVAVDRALFYATGGVALGDIHNSYVNTFNGAVDSLSKTKVGYTVGGGVEYSITNNISLRAEYRFTDFGTTNNVLANSTNGGVNVRHRETDNRVQAGLSYRFDTFAPAPVVARY